MKKSIQLIKKADGSFVPAFSSDEEETNKIKVGSEVTVSRSRNPDFHRLVFSLIRLGFSNQDTYESFDIYRQIVSMKAGAINWIEDKDGNPFPLPKSLAMDAMDQEEFVELFYALLDVISAQMQVSPDDIREELAAELAKYRETYGKSL